MKSLGGVAVGGLVSPDFDAAAITPSSPGKDRLGPVAAKAYGSGYFGAWIEDRFGLPAYHYTCDQINDMKHTTATWLRKCFLATAVVFMGLPCSGAAVASENLAVAVAEAPAWAKKMVIYEIAPKTFTSPRGPESGTFESLMGRLPYLQQLGITGIWLTGHSLADPHHFFNIWMQYATIEPDKIEPSLGTPAQFKALIDEAHRRGIRIFLDVITHGVMPDSPLVRSHPAWFRGGSWGMTDYDWQGGHTDLDDWWVKIWTDYVTQYGVDGFRLDVDIYRPDLWSRIRQKAAAMGHPIIIIEETGAAIPGISDFGEHENDIMTSSGDIAAPTIATPTILGYDVPDFYARKFGRSGEYTVKIRYHDGSEMQGDTRNGGALHVHRQGLGEDLASRRIDDYTWLLKFGPKPDGIPDVLLTVENAPDHPLDNILVSTDASGSTWSLNESSQAGYHLTMEKDASVIKLHLPTLSYGSSILLSEHGYPAYMAQGSRALFGYSFLLTPMIPIFMAGEEFNATYRPIPWMSPNLLGGKDPGKGAMIYGSMLDWSELRQPRHRDMLADVTRMLAIRRQEQVLAPQLRGDIEPNLIAVPYTADTEVPVPYMRWNAQTAIVVVANRHTDRDAHLSLRIPLNRLSADGRIGGRYSLTDLWNGGKPRRYTEQQLSHFACIVRRDETLRGGLGIFKIEWMR